MKFAAAVGALAVMATPALGQDSIQETSVAPYFAEGRLQGCAANFEITQADHLYNAGQPVHMSGSFQVYDFGEARVVAVLKLGLFYGGDAFEAPSGAYLVDGFQTSADEATSGGLASDSPGFGLFGFRLEDVTANSIGSLMGSGQLSFAYERGGGRSAVPVRLILQDDSQREAWAACFDALIEPYR
ncbi:MAG: hypothetical protein IOB84_13430 [Brevundimonas sp.]|nr:hypothetical protein [Brevundimonas sp.]